MYYESYLVHHGIRGQRWGVRRFQNADGSLTGAGRRRYDLGNPTHGNTIREGSVNRPAHGNGISGNSDRRIGGGLTTRMTESNLKKYKQATDSATNAVNQFGSGAKKLYGVAQAKKERKQNENRPREDLSKMSDRELQQKINRMNMERQYHALTTPQNVDRGRERIDNIISVAGGVLGVTSSALGIALAIKQLKGA